MTVAIEYVRGPLTVAQYLALPEDSDVRFELQEGNLVVSPSPTPRHQKFGARLFAALEQQAPSTLVPAPDVDVDLEIVPPTRPGFVRAPDVVVTTAAAAARVDAERDVFRAAEVLLVVEVLSPGSRRTDSMIKFGEYAEAGIPHYWIVDLEGGVSLRAFRLEGNGYSEIGIFTGIVDLDEPFALRLDLDALAR